MWVEEGPPQNDIWGKGQEWYRGKITPILTFPHQGGRDKRGGGLPVPFAVFPDDVAEAGEGEVAGDDGYVFVFDGFEEGAAGLVGEGPVIVEVAVPMVFGDLGGMDENVALDEGLLALGGDEDAHVARGVAGGVDGADFRGEVGVFGEGVEEAEFDEALDGGFHEGDGLVGLDFGLSEVVEVFLVNDVAGVGEGGYELALLLDGVPAYVVAVEVGEEDGVDFVGLDVLGEEVVHELAFESADGFYGAGAVAGVDEDGLLRGAEEVAADFDEHEVVMEGVGVALAVGFPGFGGDFGPELVEGHGEGEAHVGEGDDLDVADGHGEVGRHGTSVGGGWGLGDLG